MSRYRITPKANDDLFQIVDFILQSNPTAARHVFDVITSAMRRIARNPGIGHLRNDIADESVRVLPVFSYLIIYRAETKPVEIIRILHGARDLPGLLD